MSKRITIILDDDIDKKLRLLQAKYIKDTNKPTSFSSVINQVLSKELRH